MIEHFAVFIQNIFGKVTADNTVTQRFDNRLFVLAFGNSADFDTFDSIVAHFHFAYSAVCQNCVNHCFGVSIFCMCQHFTFCVNNVFGNFFAVEVMHQVFFHYLVGIFAADVNLNGFSCFAVHIIGCIQVNFKHVACNKFIVNIFRNNGICFGNQFAGYRLSTPEARLRPITVSRSLFWLAPRVCLHRRLRSLTRLKVTTSQSSSRTITSCATSTRRRVR